MTDLFVFDFGAPGDEQMVHGLRSDLIFARFGLKIQKNVEQLKIGNNIGA